MTDVGKLVVISGPSGAGKTSVCRALKQHPAVEFSVSATTRAQREGERDGVDYHFLTREDFQRRLSENQFLEWASYNGNLYGTPRWPMDAALARGLTFLVEIEVKGTRQLRERGTPGLYVFIAPPSIDELRRRLLHRGSNDAVEIEQRVRIAEHELAAAREHIGGQPLYDHIIENRDLDETIRRVKELLWP
ncbi:MAG: guanylate kinase [Planctomycetes bacterium]|nr:guanylate kinase [Planctomycetota bacterium]MCC7397039.1 guanylate kinase [Planctomycetota bacterium]